MRLLYFRVFMLAALMSNGAPAAAPHTSLPWQPWSDGAFATARQQHKFVLLDLEAVWCHWCHVMDDVTYKDPAVVRLLQSRYVLVKVDQDARPDISNRYQDYGWPATVIFAADGSEIVKRQGYLPPQQMASILQAVIDDPSPGPSVEKETALRPAVDTSIPTPLLTKIKAAYEAQYDRDAEGWAFGHKYLDEDSVEYGLRLAAHGDTTYARRTEATLHAAAALIDPVWGGAYQYSVDGNWKEPHYEKLIFIQSAYLREYALSYAQTHRGQELAVAEAVHRYVHNFLTDPATGAFYVSQDADVRDGEDNEAYFKLNDKGRRAQGIPRIDRHVYARENGWMIAALCDLYAASGDRSALEQAERAARWVMTNRSLPGGGFRHDETDRAGPYLGDTLAMGRAMLELYDVTGNRKYLSASAAAGTYIGAHFAPRSPGTGFLTSPTRTDVAYRPHPDREENIALVRYASLLALAAGDTHFHDMAAEAMRYIAAPAVAVQPLSAGVLLAHDDFVHEPLHLAVVGAESDAAATALHTAALRSIASQELIEWRDPADPHPLPSAVTYPQLRRAALFLCTSTACSSPIFRTEEVAARVERAQRSH